MASFYDFRAEVATAMDMYLHGIITGEEDPVLTYIEDSTLLPFTSADVLVGGCLPTMKE